MCVASAIWKSLAFLFKIAFIKNGKKMSENCRGFIRSRLPAIYRHLYYLYSRLLNPTSKRVVVVISSTEMGRNNYESLYFILEFAAVQSPTYYLWPSTKKINETPGIESMLLSPGQTDLQVKASLQN